MSRSRENDGGRMVQLTLSNAVDQSQKIRVEVPAGTTVEQAARDAGIAPQGSFDVFTPGGEAVTQTSVDQHRDAVLYVGPQKVAGGDAFTAEFDDGDFVLEPEPGVEVVPAPPAGPKAVTFVSVYDPTARHEVVPQEGQSVRDAAAMAGLAPRDGSGWDVFDALAEEVGDRVATELTGEVLYVGPRAVAAGGTAWSSPGLAEDDFRQMKIGYPSIVKISNHRLPNGNSGVVQLSMIGKKHHRSGRTITYQILIDFRGFPAETPIAYVRTPDDDQIRHCNVGHAKNYQIAPRLALCHVCVGNYGEAFEGLVKDRLFRLGCYLNQLQHTLSNPNPDDPARSA